MRNLLNLLVRATTKIQGFFLSSKLTNPELERLRERAPEWEQIFAAETGILKGLDLVPLLMARSPGMLSFCRKYGTLSRQEPLQTAFVLASFSQRQVPQIREEQLRVRVGLWSDNPSPWASSPIQPKNWTWKPTFQPAPMFDWKCSLSYRDPRDRKGCPAICTSKNLV